MNENSIMNIIAQSYYHTPAAIVANEKALRALRDVIDSALENGTGGACVYAADGEGYFVAVMQRQDMSDAPLGYTDTDACGTRDYPEWFWEMLVEIEKKAGEQNE